jgi:hypothetical protein
MDQATVNTRESYYRKNIKSNRIEASSDRGRSIIPMVVCGRQERTPGAFLLLNRHRAGSKPGEQLPSGSYCPIYEPCFKSHFQYKIILSGLTHFTASGNTNYADGSGGWQCFAPSGGSGPDRN